MAHILQLAENKAERVVTWGKGDGYFICARRLVAPQEE